MCSMMCIPQIVLNGSSPPFISRECEFVFLSENHYKSFADPSTRIQLTALAFHRRVRGGGVSKLIPHPLSLVVNVNFYSCPKTAINPSLTALHVDPSTRMQRTALACHRRVRGGEVSILIPHPLSLVVNVNFYSCPKTEINPSLTALDPSMRGVRYQ